MSIVAVLAWGEEDDRPLVADARFVPSPFFLKDDRMLTLDVVNTQPPEKPDYREDGSLEVVQVWHTLQGEGPLAGTPAVFVRLAGCSLLCDKCDTDYTSMRQRCSVSDLLSALDEAGSDATRLIVLTGGEPFRQNIVPFVKQALALAWRVQIETNGTYYLPELPYDKGFDYLSVVCSPKTVRIHPDLSPSIDAYKYVLDADHVDPHDGLPTLSLGRARPARPEFKSQDIYVQPLDEGNAERNARHAQACVTSCLRYGYRYSHQLHKHLGLA